MPVQTRSSAGSSVSVGRAIERPDLEEPGGRPTVLGPGGKGRGACNTPARDARVVSVATPTGRKDVCLTSDGVETQKLSGDEAYKRMLAHQRKRAEELGLRALSKEADAARDDLLRNGFTETDFVDMEDAEDVHDSESDIEDEIIPDREQQEEPDQIVTRRGGCWMILEGVHPRTWRYVYHDVMEEFVRENCRVREMVQKDVPPGLAQSARVTPDAKRRNCNRTPVATQRRLFCDEGGKLSVRTPRCSPTQVVRFEAERGIHKHGDGKFYADGDDIPPQYWKQAKKLLELDLMEEANADALQKKEADGGGGEVLRMLQGMKQIMEANATEAKQQRSVVEDLKKAQDALAVSVGEHLQQFPKVVNECVEKSKPVMRLMNEMDTLKKTTKMYREAIVSAQRRECQAKGRLFGIPREWKDSDIRESSFWMHLVAVKSVECWRKRDGTGVGIADVTFESASAKQESIRNFRAAKPVVNERKIFLNVVGGEVQELLDKPLKEALRDLRKTWSGSRMTIKINWQQRTIEGEGRTIAVQDSDSLQLVWKLKREQIVDETSLRLAEVIVEDQ